jgi:serine/threonine protein kinase
MAYLQSQEIIHRDLATRNILVVSEKCVKLSDFGFAQKTTNGYYYTKTERPIPILWYALESLKDKKYSCQSDVWSFGVTLYEMFTFGQSPILEPGQSTILEPGQSSLEKLIKRLDNGER